MFLHPSITHADVADVADVFFIYYLKKHLQSTIVLKFNKL